MAENEENEILDIIVKVICNEHTEEITENLSTNSTLLDLFYEIKGIEAFHVDDSVNLIFIKYPEPEKKEIFEVFLLTEENKEDELKNYSQLIEKDGNKTYFVYFEIRTYKKFTLRVLFYGPKDNQNYLEQIKDFCQDFISKNSFDFNEYEETNYLLYDNEVVPDKDDKDHLVVFSVGRYLDHVLEKIGTIADSVLIYTSLQNVERFRQLYKTDKFKQVKDVSKDISELLKDSYFLPSLDKFLSLK